VKRVRVPRHPADFHRPIGYGAVSGGPSNLDRVRGYVDRQEEHHRRVAFQDEFRDFLNQHGVAFDERYVWD
jgi:hypothetical protein